MSRITRAAAHLSSDAVNAKLQGAANVTERRRWLIVYNALVDPRPASQIALHTGVSVATVRLVISTYNRLSPAALDAPGKGGPRNEYLTVAEEQALLASSSPVRLVARSPRPPRSIRCWKPTWATRSTTAPCTGCWSVMAGGSSFPANAPTSGSRHAGGVQKTFMSEVVALSATRAPEDDRPLLLMAQEGRFGRISSCRRAWAPPGVRPQAPRQGIPDNIRLLAQPARSPELNSVEHIWEELREKHFHNRAFPSLDAVEETLITGLHQFDKDPKRLRSMTYFPHFRNLS